MESEAVAPGGGGQFGKSDVIRGFVFQQGQGPPNRNGHDRRSAIGDRRCPADQTGDQAIQSQVARQTALTAMQGCEGPTNGARQRRIVRQCMPETERDRPPYCGSHVVASAAQPALRQIEHGIGKPARFGAFAVVPFQGFDQDESSRGTDLLPAATAKALHTLKRDPDQPFVVVVRIIGMPAKMRPDRLDTGVTVPFQGQPVVGTGASCGQRRCGPVKT